MSGRGDDEMAGGKAAPEPGKRTAVTGSDPRSGGGAGEVGKRTLTAPRPMEPAVRSRMESSFGTSFADVRIHEDSEAASVGAQAFTRGSDIHFAPGQYQPDTAEGAELLGHELTHVVQQQQGMSAGLAIQARKAGTATDGTRSPLEEEADSVGSRVAAGGPAGSIGGLASKGAQHKGGDDASQDAMPPPVTMSPLGDRMEVSFKAVAAGSLEVRIHYTGSHVAEPKQVVLPMWLRKDPKGGTRTFRPSILARLEKELWFDLFGDASHVVAIHDDVAPDPGDFDRRKHHFELRVNGGKIAVADLAILLGQGKSDKPATGGPTDDLVSVQTVKLLGASFQVKARRFGDSDKVQLRVDPLDGESPKSSTALVPVKAPFAALGVKILKNDGRSIKLSLDKDGSEDAMLVHTVGATDEPGGSKQQRVHHLRTFDKEGMLLGEAETVHHGAKIKIPHAQDELGNKPDTDKEWPATRPPQQDDIAGETSKVFDRPGGIHEMRIDGDGDRGKELLLRFKSGESSRDAYGNSQTKVRVDVVQISSQTVRSFEIHPYLERFEPSLWLAADGKNPARIQLGHGNYSGVGPIKPMLQIEPPVDTDAGRSYQVVVSGLERATVAFPKETTPTAPLVQDDLAEQTKETPQLGGVQFRELSLGDYGDRFRFTLERTGLFSTFGVAGVNANGGVAADGFRLTDMFVDRLELVSGNPTAVTIRVSPKSTITIHDRISATFNGQGAKESPETSREHFMTVSGPAVPDGERILKYQVDQNRFQTKWAESGAERDATTGAQTVGALADQVTQGSVDNVFYAFTKRAEELRKEALEKGLITKSMYDAWESLMSAMAELDPMTDLVAQMKATPKQQKHKEDLQETAGIAADVLSVEISDATNPAKLADKASATDTSMETRKNGGGGGFGYTNKYTGGHRTRFQKEYQKGTGTLGLGNSIRKGEWKTAYKQFDQLRVGFDKFIASKDKELGATLDYVSNAAHEMGNTLNEGDGTEEGKVRRVYAHFVPDSKKRFESREGPSSVPLQFYTWREDGKWFLRDLTNPHKVQTEKVDAGTHAKPPPSLFAKLNWDEHFPNGLIRWQVDGGETGSVTVDDSDWDFWTWLEVIGFALAVAGVALASGGLATPALIAFAASGVAGIAVSVHNMVEKADHDALDATTVMLEVGNIIANLAVVGQSASKIIVNSARQAAIKGAAWTGGAAKFAALAERSFIPLAGMSIGGNVTTVVAMSAAAMDQLNAIEQSGGSDGAKRKAILTVLGSLLATGAMTALSIHGDIPALRGKQPPNIVLDFVNGKAIAHAGGVRIGGGMPEHAIHVDPKNPDAHAGARWQSEQLEDAAKHSGDKETQKAAQDLLDDKEFMDWYRAWMAEPNKVEFKNGKALAKMPTKNGGLPPDAVQKRLQAFVDNPKTGILLYEKGFANAEELRKLEAAAHKAGVELQLDPTHPDWKKNRGALRKALGNDAEAEAMLKRYEQARSGALGNLDGYLAERDQLNQLVPDTELERIRGQFEGYQVYVTGSATQPGKPLSGSADLALMVVVPDGMAPDLMAAIEQRAKSLKILPDPAYLKQHPELPQNHTVGVDAKVMTKEQFFGMTTAHPGVNPKTGNSRTPLRFHSLDSENDIVVRAVNNTNASKVVDPADMAEMRRMIGLGRLDPAQLPAPLREKLPKHAGIDENAARAWAEDLSNSNPEKMGADEVEKDLEAYLKRKEVVEALYEKAKKDPNAKLPAGVTMEQLELAVKGDKNGVRVPLTFSVQGGKLGHDVEQAKKLYAEFQAELKAVFTSEGISDAVVVQLGSGTTGWSSAPGTYKVNGVDQPKVGKEWKPTSDTDFAIFSDQALAQAMQEGASINPKNKQAGKYTTIKNSGKDGTKGFSDTKLGKKLEGLSKEWNERIYGKRDVDGFDFKLNLQSDAPFKSAVPVLQVQKPKIVPLGAAKAPGGTHAVSVPGKGGPYFGVTIKDPRVILPPDAPGRREFHITVLSPPELASIPAYKRARVASGVDIPGEPTAGEIVRKDIGDTPGYQLEIVWPEAQTFRSSLGLGPKDLHVSLNGGIGEAIAKREAAHAGTPDVQE